LSEALDIPTIQGAADVVSWFGWWPSFHDAEVVGLLLDRGNPSVVRVHYFNTTSVISPTGHYVTEKHAVVTFEFREIVNIDLAHFNHQNVLSAIIIRNTDDVFELLLGGCYGLQGSIFGKGLSVSVEPGLPEGRVYA
jgi:hypothetical protein